MAEFQGLGSGPVVVLAILGAAVLILLVCVGYLLLGRAPEAASAAHLAGRNALASSDGATELASAQGRSARELLASNARGAETGPPTWHFLDTYHRTPGGTRFDTTVPVKKGRDRRVSLEI